MQRRKYLATISASMSGLALAGCISISVSDDGEGGGDGGDGGSDGGDGGDGGSDGGGDDSTSTSTQDPVSQLGMSGFVTADESAENFVSQIEVINPTDQSVTADFSAVWDLKDNKGEISSVPEERTIESDGSQEFQLEMKNIYNTDVSDAIGVLFLGFQMQLLINGEVQSNTCPDTELSNSNEQGCQYPFGLIQTHVEVEYSGDWSGTVSGGGNISTVSKQTSILSETTDISYIEISNDTSIVSANAQKQDNSLEEVTIRIVHQDEVVAEQSTSSAYGMAQVSETL